MSDSSKRLDLTVYLCKSLDMFGFFDAVDDFSYAVALYEPTR